MIVFVRLTITYQERSHNLFYKKKLKNNKPVLYTQICAHKKTERIPVRIEQPVKRLLKELAGEKQQSLSETIREVCLKELEAHEKLKGFTPEYGKDWALE